MSALAVAVVITCYELGRTLEEAVDSVRGQTQPPEEIVVVDDGSRDPFTIHVLERLSEDDDIRMIRSHHAGPAHARNTGVESSVAPLVVLLDADDVFEPDYLERAAGLLTEHPELSFVCCALQAFGRASYRWTPPPYSVGEAIGRGACGHISTVFRRDVWEAVGGFDPALVAYEDVDFWLCALELGFRGEIVDEALLRYRVRRGSRYHGVVVQGDYLRAKTQLLDKHRALVAANGEDVFASLLDFQRELRGHSRALAAERRNAREQLQALQREITELRTALSQLGAPSFDWGNLVARATEVKRCGSEAVEEYYLERFLAEAGNRRQGKILTLRAGRPWPKLTKATYDTIVVIGALELERDPCAALKHCRRALRPGGVLLVAANSIASGKQRGLGFTQASLRAILSSVFNPASVEVFSYGNLVTCLAAVAGIPPAELQDTELHHSDPSHPVLVAARVEPSYGDRQSGARSTHRAPGARRPPSGAVINQGVVLAYHRIAHLHPDTHGLCTPPELFERHMTFLAEHCEPMPLQDLTRRAAESRLPPRAVAVTFDDGYLDNLEVASPILNRLGVPATFFINSERLDEEREGWWDVVEHILVSAEPVPEHLRLAVDGSEFHLPSRSGEERHAALFALHGRMLTYDVHQRDVVMAQLVAWSGHELAVRSTHRLMTSEEVAALADRPGHELGAHGMHHLDLTAHAKDVRTHELRQNRLSLEGLATGPVSSLAYPYGACDQLTTEVARLVGFTLACTVDPDPVTSDSDPLRLPRFEVGGDVDGFELRLECWLAGA